jgi:hypothetical protein
MKPSNLEPTIRDMIAEIELDLAARNVTDDADPAYGAYFVAKLELECSHFQGRQPNLAYVHNVLAAALNRPLATRH